MLKKPPETLVIYMQGLREERKTVGYTLWTFWWYFLLGGVFSFCLGPDFTFRVNEMVQSHFKDKERASEFGKQACFFAF